ncbi:MAG TPA: hypothetical protein VF683_09800, partial [Chthoniobacterales bacterium]
MSVGFTSAECYRKRGRIAGKLCCGDSTGRSFADMLICAAHHRHTDSEMLRTPPTSPSELAENIDEICGTGFFDPHWYLE